MQFERGKKFNNDRDLCSRGLVDGLILKWEFSGGEILFKF